MTVDRGTVIGMSDFEKSTERDNATPSMSTVRIPRTAAATAGRMRASEERTAARIEARGWLCVAPDHPMIEAVRLLLYPVQTK